MDNTSVYRNCDYYGSRYDKLPIHRTPDGFLVATWANSPGMHVGTVVEVCGYAPESMDGLVDSFSRHISDVIEFEVDEGCISESYDFAEYRDVLVERAREFLKGVLSDPRAPVFYEIVASKKYRLVSVDKGEPRWVEE